MGQAGRCLGLYAGIHDFNAAHILQGIRVLLPTTAAEMQERRIAPFDCQQKVF